VGSPAPRRSWPAIASRHKKGFEAWIASLMAEAGIADAAGNARWFMLLLDGAVTQSLIHRDPSYAEAAIGALHLLLANAGAPAAAAAAPRTAPATAA
jgi:hypothetical protein